MNRNSRILKLEQATGSQRPVMVMSACRTELDRLVAEQVSQGKKAISMYVQGVDFSLFPPMPGPPDPFLVTGVEMDELIFDDFHIDQGRLEDDT